MILYAISDRRLSPAGDLIHQASSLIRGGVDWLQIREKDLPDGALLQILRILVPEARRFGVSLLVNGRIDLALSAGASGVHLPAEGVPTARARKWLPSPLHLVRSCHTLEEVRRAEEEGADAVTLGPLFDTPSKRPYGPPMGLEPFRATCTEAQIPVIGLGGIDRSRVLDVVGAGSAGIAAIRLFCSMKNPLEEVPELRNSLMDRGSP